MIVNALKYPWRIARKKFNDWKTYQFVSNRFKSDSQLPFAFSEFKSRVISFVDSLMTDNTGVRFKYSASVSQPTLYASAYACNTYSLLRKVDNLSDEVKKNWVAYFDSFQREKDGLFYDPIVKNEHYDDSDWWGARHQALHMISAYTQLNSRPRYPFTFLEQYYNPGFIDAWFDKNESMFIGEMNNDFDNKLMNISSLLQYQRDFWDDKKAGAAVKYIQECLLRKINPNTGIWGDSAIDDPILRSRKVQFAYHLFPLFFYDNIFTFDFKKIVEITLLTQNRFGGFGVGANSSACDDIDSLDILIRLSKFAKQYDLKITKALQDGMRWVLLNQMEDGGFVFRLNEGFTYGHSQLSSLRNESGIFPTWFRTLSMAYVSDTLGLPSDFKLTRCPGYEF